MKLAISAVLLMFAIGAPAYALQDPEKEKEKPQSRKNLATEEPANRNPTASNLLRETKPPQEAARKTTATRQQTGTNRPRPSTRPTTARSARTKTTTEPSSRQQTEKDRAKQDRATQEQQHKRNAIRRS